MNISVIIPSLNPDDKLIKVVDSLVEYDFNDIIIVNDGSDLDPKYKLFTTGKLLDRSVNIDGMFNYLLYAEKLVDSISGDVSYKFRTHSLGPDTCRSTAGCFEDLYIEPDMKLVIDTINAFENED